MDKILQEKLEDEFQKIGFSSMEAKVNIYLHNTGEKKSSEISEKLKLTKVQTYFSLKNLQKKV